MLVREVSRSSDRCLIGVLNNEASEHSCEIYGYKVRHLTSRLPRSPCR
jgi:hypothetical protein